MVFNAQFSLRARHGLEEDSNHGQTVDMVHGLGDTVVPVNTTALVCEPARRPPSNAWEATLYKSFVCWGGMVVVVVVMMVVVVVVVMVVVVVDRVLAAGVRAVLVPVEV